MPKLGRFAKMMALQKERALKLGYSIIDAEAIGYAQALKYAIFKSGHGGRGKGIRVKEKLNGKKDHQPIRELNKTFNLYFQCMYPFVGGKTITERDYQAYWAKFPRKVQYIVEEWARDKLANITEEILKNERKFFDFWKGVRNEEIKI